MIPLDVMLPGMNDVIDTLRNLAREDKEPLKTLLVLTPALLEQVVDEHRQLLRGKRVEVSIAVNYLVSVFPLRQLYAFFCLTWCALPWPALRKAMCVTEGETLRIIDSGCGLDKQPDGHQGSGPGLLSIFGQAPRRSP